MRKVVPLLSLTLYLSSSLIISGQVFADHHGSLRIVAPRFLKSADNDPPTDPKTVLRPEVLLIKDQDFLAAYRDGYTILSADNNCSRFFGDQAAVLEVFNQMLANFRKGVLEVSTGIKMSGAYSNYRNAATGFAYRLFDHEIINSRGSFYSQKRFNSQPRVPEVGHFAPNTRRARVLMLLHELAHLIKGQAGRWLIPDDGQSINQSHENTALIEKQCGEEIRKLEQ